MLEVRILNKEGIPIPTLEDITTPRLVKGATVPKGVVLADYCFGNQGPFLVWKKNLPAESVAAVTYTKEGNIGSLIVQERKIEDREERETYLRYLAKNCLLTRYAATQKSEEVYLFYIPPFRRSEVYRLVKRQVKAIR
jgi:hypothetical protein